MWNIGLMIVPGKTEELGDKPLQFPLRPPRMSHGIGLALNPGFGVQKPATNHVIHGMTL